MRLRLAITVFFLLSGATALVYQVIWVRMLGLTVGHSILAVATVVATYMAGLGLGARLAAGLAQRLARPLAGYGLLEVGIGIYAALSPLVLGLIRPLAVQTEGGQLHLLVTLLVAMAVLLPPTLAMGATLPLLTRWYTRDEASLGLDMGWLYAVNTTGAFLGAFAAGYLLLPGLGQPGALYLTVLVNLSIGVAAFVAGRRHPLAPQRWQSPASPSAGAAPQETLDGSASRMAILLAFALSGAAAMINQVAWTRGFCLFTGSTTYAFSSIVCAFIAGLALGGHVASRWVDRARDRPQQLAMVNAGIAVAAAALIPLLGELPVWLLRPIAALNGSFVGTQAFLFAVVFSLVLLPTVLMGSTYPLATRALVRSPAGAARAVGRAYAWNTAGAVLGSLGAGLLLVRLLQLQGSLWLAVGLNLLAAAVLLARRRPAWLALPLFAALGWSMSPDWNPRHMNLAPYMYGRDLAENPSFLEAQLQSGSILFHEDGVGATVTVVQRDSGAVELRINGKTDASTELDRVSQGLTGVLPLLLARGQERILVVGLGSGMTLAASLELPVEEAVVVELLPEVVRGAAHFDPLIGGPLGDERTQVRIGDGRHHLLAGQQRYDVVNSYPTNLFISGISTLFTVEAFQAMRQGLRPGGVVLIWLQGYLLSEEDFRTVLRSFQHVFPETHLWNAGAFDFCLTGHLDPLEIDAQLLQTRLSALAGGRAQEWTGLRRVEDLQRHYLLGPAALEAYVGEGPLQRDWDPFLEFSTPKALLGGERLLDTAGLLELREALPLQTIDMTWHARLAERRAQAREIELAALNSDLKGLQEGLAADPGHASGRERFVRLLHPYAIARLQQGNLEEAEAAALQVLRLEPLLLPAWRLLAEVRLAQGDEQGALGALEQGRQLQPWNPYAWLAEGRMLQRLGRRERAAAALEQAAQLDPHLPELGD